MGALVPGEGRVDLAVAGGGPAGAACALEASRIGLTVVVLDPAEAGADPPCGEGIMPSGIDVLRSLGLSGVVASGRPFPGIRHLVAGARPLQVDLPRPGVALERPVLTAALAAAARAAPRVLWLESWADASRAPSGGGFEVDAGAAGRFHASTLVAADGAHGRTARWLRTPCGGARPGHRFGLRTRHRERERLDRVEVHMGNGCEVYLTPLPGGLVNVAVLFERAPRGLAGPDALCDWALSRHPAAARRLGERVTPPAGRALGGPRPRAVAEDGAFLAGDAAGIIDPIVGCGVAIALTTGVLAARAAAAVLRGRDPVAVSRAYAAARRRACGARHVLASLLRRADAHPRLARSAAALLSRMPSTTRSLARVAAGAGDRARAEECIERALGPVPLRA